MHSLPAEALDLLERFPYWPHAPRDASARQVAEFAAGLLRDGAHHIARAAEGRAEALWVRQDLPWDSEKLGLKSARATFVVAPGSERAAALCESAVEAALREGYGYLFTRVDARDLATVQACEKAGFVVVDAILSQYIDLPRAREMGATPEGLSLREGGPQDAPALQRLVDATLLHSRFHDDPKVGRERGRELYREWAHNSVHGLNQFTAIASIEGVDAGFLTVKDNAGAREAFGKGYGRIELVAVDARFRGQGVVGALTDFLIAACPRLGWERLGIGTQTWNVAAIRAYQRAGFTPGDAIFSMRWRADD